MSNETDSILQATEEQPNAASRQDIRQRVRKLHEDVRHLSKTLDRAREHAAEAREAVAVKREEAS